MSYIEAVASYLPSLLVNLPWLLAWLVGIVLAVRMIRRGGGKAEKLLLIGCSLTFFPRIMNPFLQGLAPWLVARHVTTTVGTAGLILSLPTMILNMAGIICLVAAFWIRWRTTSITTQWS